MRALRTEVIAINAVVQEADAASVEAAVDEACRHGARIREEDRAFACLTIKVPLPAAPPGICHHKAADQGEAEPAERLRELVCVNQGRVDEVGLLLSCEAAQADRPSRHRDRMPGRDT